MVVVMLEVSLEEEPVEVALLEEELLDLEEAMEVKEVVVGGAQEVVLVQVQEEEELVVVVLEEEVLELVMEEEVVVAVEVVVVVVVAALEGYTVALEELAVVMQVAMEKLVLQRPRSTSLRHSSRSTAIVLRMD
ncbi:unnamed protein product [Sphenostylis stenocarpa]|uniref:Uncharacterized protein n=1 Tax=Sphenostylis stenocarpa TaxID=92480 RepID=A0AA86SKD0_9FABA|nr:unnamed protein product [Sphenostylis stenocarpa]